MSLIAWLFVLLSCEVFGIRILAVSACEDTGHHYYIYGALELLWIFVHMFCDVI